MAKLVKKSLLLCGIMTVILLGFFVLSATETYRDKLAFWTMSGDYPAGKGEVEAYIAQAQSDMPYTKLILGDSVCNQMLNDLQEYNDEYCIIGNNRGLTMAGQYLLLNEFLKWHENVTDVYIIVGLDALESEIDITYGYQYVVVPFSRIDVLDSLEAETLEEMSDTFGFWALQPKVAEVIGDSSVGRKLYLNYLKQKNTNVSETDAEYGELSNTTIVYLEKMYEMCEQQNITLHLLPDPLADNSLRYEQAQLLEEDFKRTGLSEHFSEYFSLIHYYPNEEFMDGVHFGELYDTQEIFNNKIREIYMDAGYLEGLCLDFTSN